MLKEKFEQIKSLIVKYSDNKKKIENLVVFIIILIITIIVINMIWNDDKKSSNVNNENMGGILAELEDDTIIQTSDTTNKNELEEKLENILNKIEGVGDVKVMITYSQTSQTIAMYNEDSTQNDTEESDTRGRNKENN